ncbi:MAG: lipid-transfer protein [Proteobacteria bacterium]|nr:lipid-transfer protein [Pseudomonadota bacterium]
MSDKVYVVGVGMTRFEKPGRHDRDYPDFAEEAGGRALADAGIPYDQVEQAVAGYCYGDSTAGQRAIYTLGLTGIPVYNVNNNCATGATALFIAKQFVASGIAECVLALGFERMEQGSLGMKYLDRVNPMDRHLETLISRYGMEQTVPAAQFFGRAGREHMERYGTKSEHFAKIGWKNHKHSVNNPYSQFRDEYSLEDIQSAPMIFEPLTKLQCCPTSDGAAAAILANEGFVRRHGLEDRAVEILGMAMATDTPSSFEGGAMTLVGYDMTRGAAGRVYKESGFGPENVDVVELHDCFSANELISYEALGLCGEGEAGEFIDSGAQTYGGQVVVNPSGGLISKGHPLGATGLAQCAELAWQLRGDADDRQVSDARVALQHNLGLGGAAVVALYRKADLTPSRGDTV